jgi:Fic family protein
MALKLNRLNKRQEAVLALAEKRQSISAAEAAKELPGFSRITIVRDFNALLKNKYLERSGRGRGVVYKLSKQYLLLRPLDQERYFKDQPDKREVKEKFNFEIFGSIGSLFNPEEIKKLDLLTEKYRLNVKKLSQSRLQKNFERLTIELSWKSALIEGNTYSLLETEALIKNGRAAKGHKKEETEMILNHKNALDYIRKNRSFYKRITVGKISNIHTLLVKNLPIASGLRMGIVGIIGTKYRPLDNHYQIKEALEDACSAVNKEKNPFDKALILMILIAYIQPFADGNKRAGRMLGNAVLLAHNLCPLSYRSVDEVEYKKAVILFYEQNNISYFKQLFIEQFDFAVNNYFLA